MSLKESTRLKPRQVTRKEKPLLVHPLDCRAIAIALGLPPDNLSPTFLKLPKDFPFEKWNELRERLQALEASNQWWQGDSLRDGDNRYGDRYKKAVDEGFSYGTAANLVSIARKFADTSRRREKLLWNHHAAVAALKPADADRLLEQAEAENWSVKKLRAAVFSLKHPPDVIPALPSNPVTKVGDLWLLGDHRLLCGDSTKANDVAHLWGNGPALRMIWTDPPYGVDYGKKTRDLGGAFRARVDIQGDGDGEEAASLFRDALSAAIPHAMPGAALYATVPSGENLPLFTTAMNNSGFRFKHSLVWVKSSAVFGRTDYHYRHETILYGWSPGAHYFTEKRTNDSVFEVDRPANSKDHPTMKPVALIVPMIENSSEPGEIVYDPFSGSGSTILAAELLGRRCYAIEKEPGYVDVSVERWEEKTGQKAVLELEQRRSAHVVAA